MTEEIQCAHWEAMARDNIGTCRYCGQVKQYPGWRGGLAIILKEGDPKKANVEGYMKALKNQIPVPGENKAEEIVMSPTKEEKAKLTEKREYYEKHKAEIVDCLLAKGRLATIKEWNIPKGSIGALMERWLTPEQVDQVTALGKKHKKRPQQPAKPEPAKTEAPAKPKVEPSVDLNALRVALVAMESIPSRAVAGAIVDLQEVARDILQFNQGLKQTPQPPSTLPVITGKLGYIVDSLDNLLKYMEKLGK